MKYQVGILWLIVLGLAGYVGWKELKPQPEMPPVDYEVQFSGQGFNLKIPETMDFCGEPVPLTQNDVREKLDRELHVNVFWHSSTYILLKKANKWFPEVEKILKKNNIPDDFKYLMVIESGMSNVTSPAGAKGFWQFLPVTAREFGLEVNREVDERYHQLKATEAACQYLKKAYEKFGNWTLVAASYNMGRAGLQREMDRQLTASYYDLLLNEETGRYMYRILALKEIFEQPEKFNFLLDKEDLYTLQKVKYTTVKNSILNLADFAQKQRITYKELKLLNPWLLKNRLTVRKGKKYKIALPAG